MRDVILCDNLIIVPLVRKNGKIKGLTLGNIFLRATKNNSVIYTPSGWSQSPVPVVSVDPAKGPSN